MQACESHEQEQHTYNKVDVRLWTEERLHPLREKRKTQHQMQTRLRQVAPNRYGPIDHGGSRSSLRALARILALLRTALRSTSSIDRYAVQRGLRTLRGLAGSESERVKVVIRFLLLTGELLTIVNVFKLMRRGQTYGSLQAM